MKEKDVELLLPVDMNDLKRNITNAVAIINQDVLAHVCS